MSSNDPGSPLRDLKSQLTDDRGHNPRSHWHSSHVAKTYGSMKEMAAGEGGEEYSKTTASVFVRWTISVCALSQVLGQDASPKASLPLQARSTFVVSLACGGVFAKGSEMVEVV